MVITHASVNLCFLEIYLCLCDIIVEIMVEGIYESISRVAVQSFFLFISFELALVSILF